MEDDTGKSTSHISYCHFNPRPPCGGRRHNGVHDKARTTKFQSTSPVWRTTYCDKKPFTVFSISIHVPRVEDDLHLFLQQVFLQVFQSTSPVWRTTYASVRSDAKVKISIHVPRVEDDGTRCKIGDTGTIIFQSTSPVWRTTTKEKTINGYENNFNPRPPCGGRHGRVYVLAQSEMISIHVPRVEDDV